MVFHPEAGRRHLLNAFQAMRQLKDTVADAAEKVVVMALVRALIARRLTGDFHGNHLSFLRQTFEETVDSGNSHTRHFFKRETMNLRRGKRIPLLLKDCLDGILLSRASFHSAAP